MHITSLGSWGGILSLTLLFGPGVSPVRAQLDSEGTERTAAARAAFEEGMAAVDDGDWTTAADRFRRSLSLREAPVVRFNLANALVEQGHLVEATEHLRRAIRDAPSESPVHQAASTRLEALLPTLSYLTIAVTGPTRGVTLQMDGDPVPSAAVDLARPIDPGEHVVVARRLGRVVDQQSVALQRGQRDSIRLEIPPPTSEELAALDAAEAASRPDGPAPAPSGGIETEWWFWTLIGLAVAGAGAAVGIWAATTISRPPDIRGDNDVTLTLIERF